jgi:hypothetical protein
MEEQKADQLKSKGYEVDDVATFLGLSPEEEEKLVEMILKARLEWITDKEA